MALANALALLLYLVSGAILIRHILKGIPLPRTLPLPVLTSLALICHAVDIYLTTTALGHWDVSLFGTLSIAGWMMALIVFLLSLTNTVLQPGLLIYPLIAITLALKMTIPEQASFALDDPALEWHVLLSLAAYSLFSLAAIQASVLAVLEWQLKQHRFSSVMRMLPPLQSIEDSLFQFIRIGFTLLTLGLATGFLFIHDLIVQQLTHKTVFSLAAWFIFATLLWGRSYYGWRSKVAIKWTLIGFFLLLLAYLGSKFVLEFILSY
ncbi:MAG TPA: phosphohydrolase [Gammaproteobacteria bacterium]|nr:phosphohydrolase [Gammaproteobacteria bacterium]